MCLISSTCYELPIFKISETPLQKLTLGLMSLMLVNEHE
jgi:hypothetical protein